MNKRPSEALRSAAAGLASSIHAGGRDAVAREAFMREWAVSGRRSTQPGSKPTGDDAKKGNGIGIWKRTISPRGAVYERDVKFKRTWHQWANVHKLLPKGEKKRVVLLGESVARGFFYDPHYTAAGELEHLLGLVKGMPAVQVTDLAKTNCNMEELLGLARSCRALEPDAVVIFAGNNWHTDLYDSLTDDDHREMLELAGRRAFGELKEFMEEKMAALVRGFLEKTDQFLPAKEMPVVFLIPGYNLSDWKNAYARRSLPWLPESEVGQWLDHKKAAETAVPKRDEQGLGTAARGMIGLDPYHPYGYELLATYHSWRGEWAEARKNLRLCRDTGLTHRGDNIHPVCFGIIRETILAEAKRYGMETVDCEAVYDADKGDGIAGRDYFLDYCHLTVEGIELTMQTAAKVLGRRFLGREARIEKTGPPKGLTDEVRAIAHFSAALHNAHRDQSQEIIAYHCRKALACSSTVEEVMLPFIDFSTRRASSNLCEAFKTVILEGKMQQYDGGFALQHPPGAKLMDIKLVDAIAAALDAGGRPIGNKIMRLRLQEHGVGTAPVDLLESFYSKTSYNYFPGEVAGAAFFQARSMVSAFSVVADGGSQLELELVYRTAGDDLDHRWLGIVVNGREDRLIRLPSAHQWEKATILIEPELLSSGVNQLTMTWPRRGTVLPRSSVDGAFRDGISGRGASGELLEALCPLLGEIHSLTAVEKSML